MPIEEAKISSKGQLVIPKYLRDAVGMKEGDIVIISKLDEKLMLMKKPADPAKALVNSGKDLALKNIRREIKGE
ncbi:MAG: AbrB/MazE/SpoVT family DNA-binding domain-containing protein [Candidatus Aenigmatarchaeota archaeon]